jgi:uncharacterized protein (TIGR03000 family)
MNRLAPPWQGFLSALVAAVLLAGSVQAQFLDPYWSTTPQIYYGPRVTMPMPSIGNAISNASQSRPMAPGTSGIGGGYAPRSITSMDLRLPRRSNTDDETKAHIWLHLPEDAEVWVNGVKTKQTGKSRYYFSPPLAPGKKYSYEMRIRWMKDGKSVEQTQRILVQAGETIRRDFTGPPSKSETRNPKSVRN